MTRAELLALPEYSTSLPTGTTLGKRWRRDANFWAQRTLAHLHFFDGTPQAEDYAPKWVVGEYVPCALKDQVGINWALAVLKE
jgi:hypothetical protein